MVQEFHVVRCFSCESFQVQQVKKVNRWSCKLCGQKQSLLKEFGRGSGADCRRHVQKLNALRGAQVDEQEHKTSFPWEQEEVKEVQEEEQKDEHVKLVSRWSRYLDTPGEDDSREHETKNKVVMNSLHGNIRSNRKRQRSGECTDETQEPYCTPAQNVHQERLQPFLVQALPPGGIVSSGMTDRMRKTRLLFVARVRLML
ncbi:MRN complex-interacting protein isoform X2 [Nothobranchius furzeri]|uniref:Transcript variant X2 n=1 Tax=Nothobranchius furzeri TaxID=105023 RepID=A0A9D2YXZ9_NOTFU|nr:transcript variant X2 [Nothobranchius furzeri]